MTPALLRAFAAAAELPPADQDRVAARLMADLSRPARGPRRDLAAVLRDIADRQRAAGFPGRSAADIQAERDEDLAAEAGRDRVLYGDRFGPTAEGA